LFNFFRLIFCKRVIGDNLRVEFLLDLKLG
jgi:hypothetical protein